MKSVEQDRGECLRNWHRTRLERLQRFSGEPPKNLCFDELNLTICCRYAESLMRNARVYRYLGRYHPQELRQLKSLVEEFERICEDPDSVMPGAGSLSFH